MAPVLRNQKASASEAGPAGAKRGPESGLVQWVGAEKRRGGEGGSLCLEGRRPRAQMAGNQLMPR